MVRELFAYENELKRELMEKFGFPRTTAFVLLTTKTPQEIETIMVFLRRYGHMIQVK